MADITIVTGAKNQLITGGHHPAWFQIDEKIPILEMSATYLVPPTTLSSFNIAIENCPFTDDLPIENGDFPVH